MRLESPVPFREAIRRNAVRQVMPTHLSSEDLQQMDQGILQRSFFSARNLLGDVLEEMKSAVSRILNPVEITRADRVEPGNPEGRVTVGLSEAEARVQIREALALAGYSPAPEDRGTIKDFGSEERINLVLRTNVQTARGYGHMVQGMDPLVLDQFPAQELVRFESRVQERDWGVRWLAAARAVGDEGAIRAYGATRRMVARKDSEIWQALGDGAGGYESDALHNPHPPFAFNSGMDVQDVDRDEAMDLGLVGRDDVVSPEFVDYGAGIEEAAA